jgi:hypothetical protein
MAIGCTSAITGRDSSAWSKSPRYSPLWIAPIRSAVEAVRRRCCLCVTPRKRASSVKPLGRSENHRFARALGAGTSHAFRLGTSRATELVGPGDRANGVRQRCEVLSKARFDVCPPMSLTSGGISAPPGELLRRQSAPVARPRPSRRFIFRRPPASQRRDSGSTCHLASCAVSSASVE